MLSIVVDFNIRTSESSFSDWCGVVFIGCLHPNMEVNKKAGNRSQRSVVVKWQVFPIVGGQLSIYMYD